MGGGTWTYTLLNRTVFVRVTTNDSQYRQYSTTHATENKMGCSSNVGPSSDIASRTTTSDSGGKVVTRQSRGSRRHRTDGPGPGSGSLWVYVLEGGRRTTEVPSFLNQYLIFVSPKIRGRTLVLPHYLSVWVIETSPLLSH